jgi:hypothetical protein
MEIQPINHGRDVRVYGYTSLLEIEVDEWDVR